MKSGGAELAERDREREPGRDQRGPGRDRQVDLAPDPRAATRRASPRPRAGAGRWTAAPGVITRTTNGIAISACAIGTSTDDVRRSSGGWSSAMRNPNPTVTAETPSGSDHQERRAAALAATRWRQRARTRRSRRRRGRSTVAIDRVAERRPRSRRIGGTRSALLAWSCRARGRSRVRARRRVERADDEHGDRHAEQHAPSARGSRRGTLGRRASAAGAAISLAARSASAAVRRPWAQLRDARASEHDGGELHDGERGRERQVRSCEVWR